MMKTVLILIISVAQASLLAGTVDVSSETWEPPIGIPVPSFGIKETYRMYDEESARNPELTYHESPSGGYYTHYIDYPTGNNSDNPFGTVESPRDTVPTNLPAGSIVEVHGGPVGRLLGYGNNTTWTASGTADMPVFIRGVDTPIYTGGTYHAGFIIYISSSYLIIEGFEFDNCHVSIGTSANVAVRNCEMHSVRSASTSPTQISNSTNTVYYNNHIHHNGLVPIGMDKDVCGVVVYTNSIRTWIVDNEINNNDGDAIIINGSGGSYDPDVQPDYVYIGRNNLHGDKENAIDLKDSDHIIISQNVIYGYDKTPRVFGADPNIRNTSNTSDHTALVLANEGNTSHWLLFNHIFDCGNAIAIHDNYVRTQSYMIGNIINNINSVDTNSKGFGVIGWRSADVYFLCNTVAHVGNGFCYPSTGGAHELCSFTICNNIFYNMQDTAQWGGNHYNPYYLEIHSNQTSSAAIVENNIFYNGRGFRWGSNTYDNLAAFVVARRSQIIGCLETNPMFVAPENGDFLQLRPESPVNNMETSDKTQAVFELFLQLYGIDLVEDIEGIERTYYPPAIPDTENTSDTSSSASTTADTADEEQTTVSDTADTGSSDSVTADATKAQTTVQDNEETNEPVTSESNNAATNTQQEQNTVSKTEDSIKPVDTTSTKEEEAVNTDSENNKKKTITVFKGKKIRMQKIFERSNELYHWEGSDRSNNENNKVIYE
jgi:hypothetical protein